jgi:hypothetical protein
LFPLNEADRVAPKRTWASTQSGESSKALFGGTQPAAMHIQLSISCRAVPFALGRRRAANRLSLGLKSLKTLNDHFGLPASY